MSWAPDKREDAEVPQTRVGVQHLDHRQRAREPEPGIVGPLQRPGAVQSQGHRRQVAIEIRSAVAHRLLVGVSDHLDDVDVEGLGDLQQPSRPPRFAVPAQSRASSSALPVAK